MPYFTLCFLLVAGLVAADPFPGGVDFELERAVTRGPGSGRSHLLACLDRTPDGRWRRVIGAAQNFSVGDQHGYVRSFTFDGSAATVELLIAINGDLYNAFQSLARYQISARLGQDGSWAGTYVGTCGTESVSGRVQGRTRPVQVPPADFTPIVGDEHPRLLFRAKDLPRLKAKLATPLGKAYLDFVEKAAAAKTKDTDLVAGPMNQAVLHQLTGEAKYAEAATAGFMKEIDNEDFGFASTGQVWAHRLLMLCVVYDCCRDTWTDEQRKKARETIDSRLEMLLWNAGGNQHPTSNWAGPMNAAAAIAALTLFTGPGPTPGSPPPAPGSRDKGTSSRGFRVNPLYGQLYRKDSQKIIDLPGNPEVAGAPALVLGTPLTAWHWSGILAVALRGNQDLLANLGKYAKADPVAGDIAKSMIFTEQGPRELAFKFEALPAAAIDPESGIDGDALILGKEPRVAVLSARFSVDAERLVTVAAARNKAKTSIRTLLDGVEVAVDAVYRLKPGRHRVLLVANGESFGRIDPVIADAGAASAGLADSIAEFGRLETACWEADGKPDFEPWFKMECGRSKVFRYHFMGLGIVGFQPESGHYGHDGGPGPAVYNHLARNCLGGHASPFADAVLYIPRHIANSVTGTTPAGAKGPQKLYGQPIHGINSLSLSFLARHFPAIPAEYQPGALWAWNLLTDYKGPGSEVALFGPGTDPVFTFLNYPLEMTAVAPSSPTWPLLWKAPTRGLYVFRNGYGSPDNSVIQVYTRETPTFGWNHPSAGAFTIQALGHEWAVSVADRLSQREEESVVLLPKDDCKGGGCGLTTRVESTPDGSGSITMNLDEIYAPKAAPPLTDKSHIRFLPEPAEVAKQPIRGWRTIAVDHSGASGAPLLFVVADHVTGGGQRRWQWQLPRTGDDHRSTNLKPTSVGDLVYNERGFTCTQGDAVLTVTIIASGKIDLRKPGQDEREIEAGGHNKNAKAGEKYLAPYNGVGILGDGDFLAIATVSKGPGPAVTVNGDGLAAKISVGGQAVAMDGDRVVFGKR